MPTPIIDLLYYTIIQQTTMTPESKELGRKLNGLYKRMPPGSPLADELDQLFSDSACLYEKQGFDLGLYCGVQFMINCFSQAGVMGID